MLNISLTLETSSSALSKGSVSRRTVEAASAAPTVSVAKPARKTLVSCCNIFGGGPAVSDCRFSDTVHRRPGGTRHGTPTQRADTHTGFSGRSYPKVKGPGGRRGANHQPDVAGRFFFGLGKERRRSSQGQRVEVRVLFGKQTAGLT